MTRFAFEHLAKRGRDKWERAREKQAHTDSSVIREFRLMLTQRDNMYFKAHK